MNVLGTLYRRFLPTIKQIYGVDNIASYTLTILTSAPNKQEYIITKKSQYLSKTFIQTRQEYIQNGNFPRHLLSTDIATQIYQEQNPKLSSYTQYRRSGYSNQVLYDVDLISYDIRIYVPSTFCQHFIYLYCLYLNYP